MSLQTPPPPKYKMSKYILIDLECMWMRLRISICNANACKMYRNNSKE